MTYKQMAKLFLKQLAHITNTRCCCYHCEICELACSKPNDRTNITCDDAEVLMERLREVKYNEKN